MESAVVMKKSAETLRPALIEDQTVSDYIRFPIQKRGRET
jgi:hypothetical protein